MPESPVPLTTRRLCFPTLGGSQALELHEPTEAQGPVVLVAPALGVRASYYQTLCAQLAAQGIRAGAMDLPGHGESPVRAGWHHDWGYADLVAHLESACETVQRELPGAAVHLLGHSIGGQTALMAAGLERLDLAGVVIAASGSPWWRAWRGREALGIRAGTAAGAALSRVWGHFPGRRVGFAGREARTLIREWARVARSGAYRFSGFDGEALLAAPGPPVLAIALRGDRFAPPAAIQHTLDKLTRRDVRLETWEDPPHGGNHNRWPSRPDHVVERVREFVLEP